ncbi:hypothetical protein ACNKXS_13790, partial [Christiangramia marina]|uniref:hypothetical protein n=1 Tax=Christiangramia marina TaxID=409436 RepID=UPI003AA80ADF
TMMSPAIDASGIGYAEEQQQKIINYVGITIENAGDYPAYAWGYVTGYGLEKAGEIWLTRKAAPVLKENFGQRTVLGASKYTNRFSLDIHGKLGKMSTRHWTFPNSMTIDRGAFLNRNFLTPLGYGTGFGQLQYFQNQ